MNNTSLKSFIAWGLFFIIIIIFLNYYYDSQISLEHFKQIKISDSLVLFFLISLYFFKYYRWRILNRMFGIKLKFGPELIIYIKSLALTFSPGKLGDFIRCYFIIETFDYEIKRTAFPIILEKLFEFGSLILLFFYLLNIKMFALLLLFILILYHHPPQSLIKSISQSLSKIKFTKRYYEVIADYKKSFPVSPGKTKYLLIVFISFFIWIIEIILFLSVIKIFTDNYQIIGITEAYISSVFYGTISFLPAGTGVSEISLAHYLETDTYLSEFALIITFLTRILTVWLPIFAGLVFILINKRNINN